VNMEKDGAVRQWLPAGNFDANGQQYRTLESFRKPTN